MEYEFLKIDVFDSSEKNVGYAIGSIWQEKLEIGGIWVNPNYRRAGIGSRLISELKKSAIEHGATEIKGRVLTDPDCSEKQIRLFYEKNGLRVDQDGYISGEI